MARDYDGDGRVDAAVYRDGYWYILPSLDGGVTALGWGLTHDIPVPADYEEIGKRTWRCIEMGHGTSFAPRMVCNGRQLGNSGGCTAKLASFPSLDISHLAMNSTV